MILIYSQEFASLAMKLSGRTCLTHHHPFPARKTISNYATYQYTCRANVENDDFMLRSQILIKAKSDGEAEFCNYQVMVDSGFDS